MISADFAPNESWSDAWVTFKLLFQPWRWKKGEELDKVKQELNEKFRISNFEFRISLFLSGRSALYYLLKSFNLPKNSEVIIQAFTCGAVPLPVIANQFKPVYVDIESETFSMDINSLTRQIMNKKTNLPKALILQHTFGLTPKYRNEILQFAKKHNLFIIEDLAHGFDPTIFKSPNSYLLSTHYYLLSFGRSKSLSSVFGGAVISKNNLAIQQSKNLSYPSYWFIFRCLLYKPLSVLIKSAYDFYLGKIIHKLLNPLNILVPEITSKEKAGNYDTLFNKSYPNAFAILLHNQIKVFEHIWINRAEICEYYNSIFKSTKRRLQSKNLNLIRFPLISENRNEILENLKKENVFLGKWYDQVVAPKETDLKRVGYRKGSCSNAEDICKKIINLPTNITMKQAQKVINALNDVI